MAANQRELPSSSENDRNFRGENGRNRDDQDITILYEKIVVPEPRSSGEWKPFSHVPTSRDSSFLSGKTPRQGAGHGKPVVQPTIEMNLGGRGHGTGPSKAPQPTIEMNLGGRGHGTGPSKAPQGRSYSNRSSGANAPGISRCVEDEKLWHETLDVLNGMMVHEKLDWSWSKTLKQCYVEKWRTHAPQFEGAE